MRPRAPRIGTWAALVGLALAGGLFALAFPPHDWWPLALVGLMPWCGAGLAASPRRALGAGWLWAVGLEVVRLSWLMVVMVDYGAMPWLLAGATLLLFAVILGAFAGVGAWLVAVAPGGDARLLWAAPAAWAGLEWLRSWLFTGFPWLPLANALSSQPVLVQTAEWWGAAGLGAWLAFVNGALLYAWLRWRRGGAVWRAAAPALGALLLVAAAWVWGGHRMAQVEAVAQAAPRLATTVVQGDVPIAMLWRREDQGKVFDIHAQLTELAAAQVGEQRPWLVVWSESSSPYYFAYEARQTGPTLDLARRLDAWIAIGSLGVVERGEDRLTSNRTWLVSPQGRPHDFYDKVHLVPFGEYVPLPQVFFFVRAVAQIGLDQAAGEMGRLLDPQGLRLGPLICYESIFPELARAQAAKGARLLINQSNDAWFGPTGASRQHLSHLVLRCVENRLACARAANSGVSGFILPTGEVCQATPLFTATSQTRELPLMPGGALYTRLGNLAGPGGLGLALLAGLGGWFLKRQGRKTHVR